MFLVLFKGWNVIYPTNEVLYYSRFLKKIEMVFMIVRWIFLYMQVLSMMLAEAADPRLLGSVPDSETDPFMH